MACPGTATVGVTDLPRLRSVVGQMTPVLLKSLMPASQVWKAASAGSHRSVLWNLK